jgi:3-phenylpropionate/trans-cinnamate dioxygenase ferredoxin reductase subunit
MTHDRPTHVIVGASLAGASAAATLRAEGFDGRVVLIGSEPHRPYERPPLSKQLLRGESATGDAFVHPEAFYADHDIELRLGTRVTEVLPHSQVVTVGDRESIRYDRLLLTTGARARRLRVPGADLPGIHYLRDLDDVRALRGALASATRVAVVGAGWIGSEVAASVRQLGLEVALIDPGHVPLARVLGAEVGAVYRDLQAENGVELHLGTKVHSFLGSHTVAGIRTEDGLEIAADLVVVGVGAEPRIELARHAGLHIDGGIAVDEMLQTSAHGVFAAGDVAAAWHPSLGRRIRVEHWANARNQGVTAARNMLGASLAYDRVPYFFSDQYDLGMEYSGHAPDWDRVVFRGDPASRAFIAFWITDDQVAAAMHANRWGVTESLQALVRSRQPVDDVLLADPDVPLDALAGAPVGTVSLRLAARSIG